MSIKFTRNVLIPVWIMLFGLLFLAGPPQGVSASLSLLMAGVVLLPVLVLVLKGRQEPTTSGKSERLPRR